MDQHTIIWSRCNLVFTKRNTHRAANFFLFCLNEIKTRISHILGKPIFKTYKFPVFINHCILPNNQPQNSSISIWICFVWVTGQPGKVYMKSCNNIDMSTILFKVHAILTLHKYYWTRINTKNIFTYLKADQTLFHTKWGQQI